MSELEGGRPLRADAERNRSRLIAAASDLFADRGLSVTLDEVARHAGVGVGTVYRRFADRHELIDAVLQGAAQNVAALAEDALDDPDAWHGFERFFFSATAAFAENRALREILLDDDRGVSAVFEPTRARLSPAVDALVLRAQEAGELRDDLDTTDFPLIQIMLGAVAERTRTDSPEHWRRFATLLLDGLRVHRATPTPLGG